MTYTQVRITKEYREKLRWLAEQANRSMANKLEQLIDREWVKVYVHYEQYDGDGAPRLIEKDTPGNSKRCWCGVEHPNGHNYEHQKPA